MRYSVAQLDGLLDCMVEAVIVQLRTERTGKSTQELKETLTGLCRATPSALERRSGKNTPISAQKTAPL